MSRRKYVPPSIPHDEMKRKRVFRLQFYVRLLWMMHPNGIRCGRGMALMSLFIGHLRTQVEIAIVFPRIDKSAYSGESAISVLLATPHRASQRSQQLIYHRQSKSKLRTRTAFVKRLNCVCVCAFPLLVRSVQRHEIVLIFFLFLLMLLTNCFVFIAFGCVAMNLIEKKNEKWKKTNSSTISISFSSHTPISE